MTIKASPDDFIVTEHLSSTLMKSISAKAGLYALYKVKKTGLTTPDVTDFLARQLQIPISEVSAAGLKDRLAITTQYMSVKLSRRKRQQGMPKHINGKIVQGTRWDAELVGYIEQPLNASYIERNHFELVVRGLSKGAANHMVVRAEQLKSPDKDALYVTNYYGNQRFGGLRGGKDFLAPYLLRGQFIEALEQLLTRHHRKDSRPVKELAKTCKKYWGDWQYLAGVVGRHPMAAPIHYLAKQPTDGAGAFAKLPYFEQYMAVEAYQSYLWNETATRYLTEALSPHELYDYNDKQGRIVFPNANQLNKSIQEMPLPVLGFASQLSGDWQGAAREVLTEQGWQDTQDFAIPGLAKPRFGEVERQLFAAVGQFKLHQAYADDQQLATANRMMCKLTFTLPRGSYATVLLRALGQ